MKLRALLLPATILLVACGKTEQKQLTASEIFLQAQTSHSEARYSDAVIQYQKYVDQFPDSSQAAKCQFMVAYLFANDLEQLEQARVSYKTFLTKFPDSELKSSAEWELEHLGEKLSEIEVIPGGE